MTTRPCASSSVPSPNTDRPDDPPIEADFWRIVQMALGVDSDRARVREWYRTENIRELDGKTAQELVQMGEADRVIGFLRSIRRGYRD